MIWECMVWNNVGRLIGTLGFQTNSLSNFHNENQLVSHLVIIGLKIELIILTQMNTKLLKINYYVLEIGQIFEITKIQFSW
jgi:hypothetical protein